MAVTCTLSDNIGSSNPTIYGKHATQDKHGKQCSNSPDPQTFGLLRRPLARKYTCSRRVTYIQSCRVHARQRWEAGREIQAA